MSLSIAPRTARENAPEVETAEPQAIGPLWLSVAVCLLFVSYAALSAMRHRFGPAPDYSQHAFLYSSQILGAWLLLGATLATVYHRRAFLRESLLTGGRPWRVEIARGVSVFLFFILAVAIIGGLFTVASGKLPALGGTPHLLQSTDHRLHVGHTLALQMAPHSVADLLAWIAVSLSAAVCEELIFRGYLLRQCIAGLRRLAFSPRASVVLSIVITALIFSAGHLYEGTGSALAILFLAGTYAVAALRFGNLRAVIVAHFLQDFLFGLFFYLQHVSRAR